MKMKRFMIAMMMVLSVGLVYGQAKKGTRKSTVKTASTKTSSAKAAPAKAIGAWVNFNGGEDVRKIAVDSKNVYVVMNYTKRMVIIDKESGNLNKVEADHDITGVAVAGDKCYYYIDREGIFRYDSATGTSEGPLFDFPVPDWESPKTLNASPDGRFLTCGDCLIDIAAGRIVSQPGEADAVNNLGGVYIKSPEAYYVPLGEDRYKVTPVGTAVYDFYLDTVTDKVFYCMAQGQGLAETQMVPQPGVGVKKISTNFETEHNVAMFLTRDDEGNFVVTTNFEGIGFGGKNIEDPFRMEKKIASGVKSQYGDELFYSGGNDFIAPDGQGNLIFGSSGYAFVFIYNPKGINGYSELKGKAVRFE